MRLLTDAELRALAPAETAAFPEPVSTPSVSSDEFMPAPQTPKQRRLEARIRELGGETGEEEGGVDRDEGSSSPAPPAWRPPSSR